MKSAGMGSLTVLCGFDREKGKWLEAVQKGEKADYSTKAKGLKI